MSHHHIILALKLNSWELEYIQSRIYKYPSIGVSFIYSKQKDKNLAYRSLQSLIKWITVDSLISRTCIEHQWRGSRTVWRDNHNLETSTWSLSSRARALTCYCILCKGRERGLIDHLLTKRWIGIEKSTVFFVYYEQCFRSWHASRGRDTPSGPLCCPTSSTLRCISNLVRNTNQEVISARGATCHSQPCIGQYKGLLWWTINRPAPSQIKFPLWTYLPTNDQFSVWEVDTLFTFVGFLP